MANADAATPPPPQQSYDPLAAVLSYLFPGLGQIYQGRVGKGLLFLICLYGLFFYGMYLGNWQNVYVPTSPVKEGKDRSRLDALTDLARFAGQFWIGVAAWPALAQHWSQPTPEQVAMWQQQEGQGVNVEKGLQDWRKGTWRLHPIFGAYMRAPDEEVINRQLQASDKKPDLGWMYTVIAGVLNILVIYDAFAGPAFAVSTSKPATAPEPSEEKPAV